MLICFSVWKIWELYTETFISIHLSTQCRH